MKHMHTTLYRSLALLVSIFALTSSFSLSMHSIMMQEEEKTSRNGAHVELETKKADQALWVFEYTWGDNLNQFERFENNSLVGTKHNFVTDLESELQKYSINKEKLHSAFKIYKKGGKEEIIGLVFKANKKEEYDEKLMLYGSKTSYNSTKNTFEPLETKYTKRIEPRKVDLSKNKLFTGGSCSEDGGYVFDINWQKPYDEKWKSIKVNDNESGQLQMVDQEGPNPWIFEYAWDNNLNQFGLFEYAGDNNLNQFERFQNGVCVSTSDKYGFIDRVKDKLTNLSLNAYDLHSAFRIYKYKEGKEEQIIGLIFNGNENEKYDEKLVLYDKEFNPLNNPYTDMIKNRKVDLLSKRCPPVIIKDYCMVPIKWQNPYPYKELENIKVFYDNKKIQATDFIANKEPKQEETQKTKRNYMTSKALGLAVFVGLGIVVIYIMYSKGCCSSFSKKNKQQKQGR